MNDLVSNHLIFCGPFLGEFGGYELAQWVPHVRHIRSKNRGAHIVAASYYGRHSLYYGIANEFWSLPDWFSEGEYDVDCWESLCPPEMYGRLLQHFRGMYGPNFSIIEEERTPRGFNQFLLQKNQVLFDRLRPSGEADEHCQQLLVQHGDKPAVVIFAREVHRDGCHGHSRFRCGHRQ